MTITRTYRLTVTTREITVQTRSDTAIEPSTETANVEQPSTRNSAESSPGKMLAAQSIKENKNDKPDQHDN